MHRYAARTVKKNKPMQNSSVIRRLIRLGLCACILLAAVIVKNAGGADAVSDLYFRITRDVDYVQAFQTAGMALTEGDGFTQAVSGLYGDIFVTKSDADKEKLRSRIEAYYEEYQRDYARLDVPENVNDGFVALDMETRVPVVGEITDGFGYRLHPVTGETAFHYGIDISAQLGESIVAFADGEVKAVGESSIDGKFIRVLHKDGTVSYYAHCGEVMVENGDSVTLGQKIATIGQTGNATGPCLHFELRRGEVYINPLYYLWDLV